MADLRKRRGDEKGVKVMGKLEWNRNYVKTIKTPHGKDIKTSVLCNQHSNLF